MPAVVEDDWVGEDLPEHPKRGWNGVAKECKGSTDLRPGNIVDGKVVLCVVVISSANQFRCLFVTAHFEVILEALHHELPSFETVPRCDCREKIEHEGGNSWFVEAVTMISTMLYTSD